MVLSISGGRHDGREWPDAGQPLVLTDEEAADVVRGGMAVWDEPSGWDKAPAPVTVPAVGDIVSEPSPTAAGPRPVPEPAPEPVPAQEQGEVSEAPVSYAPKQAWVNWAMAHGASEDEANMMTKAQLMEVYGDRA
jgi:hypothetical protein